MLRAAITLNELLKHYSATQIEPLLQDDVLLEVLHAFDPDPKARLEAAVLKDQGPGHIVLALTLDHGARAVWEQVLPRHRLVGAEDEPAPQSELGIQDIPKMHWVYLIVAAIAVTTAAVMILHPVSATLGRTAALAAVATVTLCGFAAHRAAGALGGCVAALVAITLAYSLCAEGIPVGRFSLFVSVIPGVVAGAVVGSFVHRLTRKKLPPDTF